MKDPGGLYSVRMHERLLLDLGIRRDQGRDRLMAGKKGGEARCHVIRLESNLEEESEFRSFASTHRGTRACTISFRLCTPLNFCSVCSWTFRDILTSKLSLN